jgi:NADP-dependent 3-hydroxy acid dehydrogenase YdfG
VSRESPPVGIVTCAASGIGAATAVEFARSLGARLVLGALPDEDAAPIEAAVSAAGGEARVVRCDVRDPEQCEAVARSALDWCGRIDFAHANAGVADQSTIADGDPERWRRVIDTNVLGTAFTLRAVLGAMITRRSGHIFIMASTSGRGSYVGEPLYIASKWALVGLGHAARKEVSRHNVRVTLVEPGIVETPLTTGAEAIAPLLKQGTPLQPEDIARAIVFAFTQPAHVNVSELTLVPVDDPEDSL